MLNGEHFTICMHTQSICQLPSGPSCHYSVSHVDPDMSSQGRLHSLFSHVDPDMSSQGRLHSLFSHVDPDMSSQGRLHSLFSHVDPDMSSQGRLHALFCSLTTSYFCILENAATRVRHQEPVASVCRGSSVPLAEQVHLFCT